MTDLPKFDRSQLMAPEIVGRWQTRALIIGVVFTLVSLLGLTAGAHIFAVAALRAWLTSFWFFLGLSGGSLGLIMLTYMTGGWWGFIPRRIFQAAARNMWLMLLFFIPVAVGMWTKHLYVWADPAQLQLTKEEAALWKFQSYLTPTNWTIRAAIYWAIWVIIATLITKWSDERDDSPGNNRAWRLRFQKLAAPGLVLFGLSMTFASFDWMMSLDPRWTSTIYGMIILIGQALAAMAFATVVCVRMSDAEPMASFLKRDILHDMGKLMLAFTMFWAYVSFSQLLIIWSANLPEEIVFYNSRWGMSFYWKLVSIGVLLGHFALPFALLLSKDLKKKKGRIAALATYILLARLLEIDWQIHPMFLQAHQDGMTKSLIWLNVTLPLAMGGFWMAAFCSQLRKRALFPLSDPLMKEAMHHIDQVQFQHQT